MHLLDPAPFGRILPAMVTPMKADGAVDFEAAQRLAKQLVADGADGLVVNGTTGESPTTHMEEKVELVQAVKEVVDVPVISGAGSNDTAHTVRMVEQTQEAGADAVLVVAPYYSRPSQEGVFRHYKAVNDSADKPNEKAVNDCEEYLLNNWDSAVRRMQDKNVYGCSAEGHVSHMYSDRMSSRPMGWSEAGADAMCQLRCYVKDYGEEKILELVKYRRSHKQEEATGTEEISVRPNRGYMRSLLLHSHDNDRVYIEKLQATIPSIDIRKKLAIQERLGGI